MKVKAYYLDGAEAEARVGARAMVEFERKFDVFFADAFGGRAASRVEHAFYLTWSALRYDGQVVPEDFDDWLTGVADAEVLPDEGKGAQGKGNPTKRARSRAAS